MSDAPPKTAVELALERLRQQDAESGVEEVQLTARQTEELSAAHRHYEAQVAECKILHQAALQTTLEPDARAELDANYRRDMSQFSADRDRKTKKIRQEKS
tara:strand:+ start:3704 stop:4006 length:303 start_codon:yes stop_codon:yes gene_type:complete